MSRLSVPSLQSTTGATAPYTDAQLVDISLAFATIIFTNVFNRINDTEIDFPAAA